MVSSNYALAVVPMLLPAWYLVNLIDRNPLPVIGRWMEQFIRALTRKEASTAEPSVPPVGSQLLAYVGVAVFGFLVTNHLIPNIQVRKKASGANSKEWMTSNLSLTVHVIFNPSNIRFEKEFAEKTWGNEARLLLTSQCKSEK